MFTLAAAPENKDVIWGCREALAPDFSRDKIYYRKNGFKVTFFGLYTPEF